VCTHCEQSMLVALDLIILWRHWQVIMLTEDSDSDYSKDPGRGQELVTSALCSAGLGTIEMWWRYGTGRDSMVLRRQTHVGQSCISTYSTRANTIETGKIQGASTILSSSV